MCEIPNNVLLIDEFSALFDGFLDWLQRPDAAHALGVDRDSAIVADSFDEQDPGMRKIFKWPLKAPNATSATPAFAARPRVTIEVARYSGGARHRQHQPHPDRVLQPCRRCKEAKIEAAQGLSPRQEV